MLLHVTEFVIRQVSCCGVIPCVGDFVLMCVHYIPVTRLLFVCYFVSVLCVSIVSTAKIFDQGAESGCSLEEET